MKVWPEKRPQVNSNDITVIMAMKDICPLAERIFIAGEVDINTFGDMEKRAIQAANALVDEPLFVVTDRNTIRMTRWQGRGNGCGVYNDFIVWNHISITRREELFADEASRLGLLHWSDSAPNFYQSTLGISNLAGKRFVYCHNSKDKQHYINACILFGKASWRDIPPSAFFCRTNLRDCDVHNLTTGQQNQRDKVTNPKVNYLTNDEVFFLESLRK